MRTTRVFPRSIQLGIVLLILIGLAFPPAWVVSAQDEAPPQETATAEEVSPDESAPPEEAPEEQPGDSAPPEGAPEEQPGDSAPQEESPAGGQENNPDGQEPVDSSPPDVPPAETEVTETPPPDDGLAEGSLPLDQESDQNTEEILTEEMVAEAVETLAENNLALVDEEGNPLPLVSDEAVSLIETADPYFTSAGITYGWTNQGTAGSPVCHASVTSGYCTYSSNPITDAIDSPQYTGQQLTIDGNANDYAGTDVTISKAVNLRPRTNFTVNSITLNNGAFINWSTSYGNQYYLTSDNVFVNPGAYLSDAMEVVSSGGTVNLEDGTFDDDYSVYINKSVTITGNGANNTIVKQKSPCYNPAYCSRYFIVNANYVKISNLTLDGNTQLNTGIEIGDRSGVEISDTNLIGMTGQAVYVKDSSVDFLRNNIAANFKAIYIDDLDPGNVVTATHNRIFYNWFGIDYHNPGGTDPFVDAMENWWGCNYGPNTLGCETNLGTSRIDTSDFLIFGFLTDPNPIMVGEDSTLETFHYVSGDASMTPVPGLWWFNNPAIFLFGGPLGTLSGNLFTADTPGVQDFYTYYDAHVYWTDLLIEPFACPAGTTEDNGVCVPVGGGGGGGGGGGDDGPAPAGPAFPFGPAGLVPVTGGLTGLSCDTANTLMLENGDRITFSGPLCGYEASLVREEGGSMPAPLPEGFTYVSGMTLTLLLDGETVSPLPAPVTGTASFILPEALDDGSLTVFMWVESENGGLGGWVELDSLTAGQAGFEIPGTFVLATK